MERGGVIGSRRGMVGVALLGVAALVAGLFWFAGIAGDEDDLLVVRGAVGSEKIGFLEDPMVREILADRYGLQVDFTSAGSLELLESGPGDRDFLWPGSPIDERHYGPTPRSEEIFYSPIVLGTWAPVTNSLVAAGLVERIGGTYYINDLSRLVRMIEDGTEWSEIGLPQISGRMSIITTDPTTSNSGSSFAGLLANTFNSGEVVDEQTVDDVLGQVQAFFAPLGPMERSSGFLFQQYLEQGMETYPIIVGYEGTLIEFSLGNRDPREQVQDDIRLIYPRPTAWSSHPMIALTPNGDQLLAAVQDLELQRIAWERHGFRSRLFSTQPVPESLELVGIPPIVDSVLPLPRAAIMEQIIQALRPDDPGTARPEASPVSSDGHLLPTSGRPPLAPGYGRAPSASLSADRRSLPP